MSFCIQALQLPINKDGIAFRLKIRSKKEKIGRIFLTLDDDNNIFICVHRDTEQSPGGIGLHNPQKEVMRLPT
jgi:hypothetical protein